MPCYLTLRVVSAMLQRWITAYPVLKLDDHTYTLRFELRVVSVEQVGVSVCVGAMDSMNRMEGAIYRLVRQAGSQYRK